MTGGSLPVRVLVCAGSAEARPRSVTTPQSVRPNDSTPRHGRTKFLPAVRGRGVSRRPGPRQEFKPFKFELVSNLHERLERLKKEAGMTNEAANDALNYAVRTLLTRREREAGSGANSMRGAC